MEIFNSNFLKKAGKLSYAILILLFMTISFSSCQDWGEWDDPAGNQKNPIPEPPADKSAKLAARYLFEGNLKDDLGGAAGNAKAQPEGQIPSFEENAERGSTVLHQYFGFDGEQSISYAQFQNPLKGAEELYGASISLWVNRTDGNVWDAIWSFLDEDNSDEIDGRFYFTPNAYLGFNGTGGFFDCNWPDNVTDAISIGEWNMVTVTLDATGFWIYVNGKLKFDINTHVAWNANDGIEPGKFTYQRVIDLIGSADNFYLGYGSWWGSADLLIDDLLIYKNALTATEVSALYDSYSGLVAYYNFESNLINVVNESSVGELLKEDSGTLPTFETNDLWGSTFLHQYFGFPGGASSSYTRFDNPLKGLDINGATISIWVNRLDANVWDAIWSFLDTDNSDGIDGRVYLTPNAYLGFNGTGGFFDCNWPDNVTDAISVDGWNMVTVTAHTTGFNIYINGVKTYSNSNYVAWNAIDEISAADFDYNHVVNLLKSADNFYLGYGSWWGSAALYLDDLMIYDRALSDSEILNLYESKN